MIFCVLFSHRKCFLRVSVSLRFRPEKKKNRLLSLENERKEKIDSNVSKVKDYIPVNVSIPLFKNACIMFYDRMRTQLNDLTFSWTNFFPSQIISKEKNLKRRRRKRKKCFYSEQLFATISTTQK